MLDDSVTSLARHPVRQRAARLGGSRRLQCVDGWWHAMMRTDDDREGWVTKRQLAAHLQVTPRWIETQQQL